MKYFFRSLRFLRALSKNSRLAEITPSTARIIQGVAMDFYFPKRSGARGAVILLHGMNKHGKDDIRMAALGRSFADIGMIAVVPTMASSLRYEIDIAATQEMQNVLKMILIEKEILQFPQVAIFCASFTSCILLRTIYLPGLQEKISSVCILGGANDPRQSLETLLSRDIHDRYAKLIVIKNMLRIVGEASPEMLTALDCAIDDEFEHRDFTACQAYLSNAAMTEGERQKVLDIIASTAEPQDIFAQYEAGIVATKQAFDRLSNLSALRAYFVLVHSKEDLVMHPRETVLLYRQLRAAGVPCRKLITPLLDHADYAFQLRYVLDAFRLVYTFARFLAHIKPSLLKPRRRIKVGQYRRPGLF